MLPGSPIYQLVHVKIPHTCDIIESVIRVQPATLCVIPNVSRNMMATAYPATSGIPSSTSPPASLSIYTTASITSMASRAPSMFATRSNTVTSSARALVPPGPKQPVTASRSKARRESTSSDLKTHLKSTVTEAAGNKITGHFVTIK